MCAGKSQRKMRKRTNQNPTADEKNDWNPFDDAMRIALNITLSWADLWLL